MQPVGTSDTPNLSPVLIEEKETQPVVIPSDTETHSPQNAQDVQDMFELGAQNGGVVRSIRIEEPEPALPTLSLDEYIKSVLGEVSQGIQGENLVAFLKVSPERLEKLAMYKETAPAEELALFDHFTNLLLAHYTPIVAMLPDSFKPLFPQAIQNALFEKMAESVDTIRKIDPEFLQNVTLAASFKSHIAKLGQVMAKLESIESGLLQNVVEALGNDDKDSFIANSDVSAIVELKLFLAEVPDQIHGSIVDGVLAGIKEALANK